MRISVTELAKQLGKTRKTVWNYMITGKLRYHQDVNRGKRYFIQEEVSQDFGLTPKSCDKLSVIYCRVSTKDQIQDLEYQKQVLEQYSVAKGYKFTVISDVGSGINYNKKGLKELIQLISENKIDKLVILYPDRLLRFGNEIMFEFCKHHNVQVEIVNQTKDISKEQELVNDVLQIITVFSSKLYGSRSDKTRNIIKQSKTLWTS